MDGGQASAPPQYRAGVKPPPGFSAPALEKRLNLRRRAREDAARNLPRPDAEDLSAAEQSILETVAGERALISSASKPRPKPSGGCERWRPRRRT